MTKQQIMKCEECGQPLNEHAKFCFACGAKVIHSGEKITCPTCGASVLDALFCSECGASFSAHVEKMYVSYTHPEESVETLLGKAKTLLALEQYERARDVYEKIIDTHPDDYHGWWGLLVASTRNLSAEPSSDKVDLALTIKNVKKLASPEEYAKCEKAFIAYLMRVDIPESVSFEDTTLVAKFVEIKLKKAESLLSEGKFSEAYEVYDSVVDIAVEDYRGWWGRLLAATKNLTEDTNEDVDVAETIKNVKKLARPEEYATYEKAFVAFLKETESRPYVKNEKIDFEKKLAVLGKARIPFLDGIKAYESIEKQEREEFAATAKKRSDNLTTFKEKLAAFEKQHTDYEETIEKKGGRRKIGIFCIILGVLLAIIGFANEAVPLIVVGLIAAFLVGGLLIGTSSADTDVMNNDRAKAEIAKYRGEVSSVITEDEKAKTAFAEAAESRTKAIALMKEKVEEIDDVINKIKALQALPEEEQTLYWLKSDCETFEVECAETCKEESEKIIDEAYEAFFQKKFPVLLRCDKCGNQTVAYVDILGKFNRFDHISCFFCEEAVYFNNFLNEDGTPNVEELRRGANYRRYLAYEGLDDEYDDDEYDEEEYDEEEHDEEEYEEEDESHAVYLVSAGSYPQGVAKVIDDVLCCGMGEAREYAMETQLPCRLTSTSKKEAEQFASRLRMAGATVEVEES